MAQLGKLDFTCQDTAGNVQTTATINIFKQGASVDGNTGAQSSPYTLTVKSPGGILANTGTVIAYRAGAQVDLGPGDGFSYTVGAVTATSIVLTWAGGADATFLDEDRLVWDQQATVYQDSIGQDAKSLELSTDSNGYAYCWAAGVHYDAVKTVGTNYTLYEDVYPVGARDLTTNLYDSASAIAYDWNTERAIANAAALLFRLRTNDVLKYSIDAAGDVFSVSGSWHSAVADGATADAYALDTDNAFTTGGANLLSLLNNGVEKFFVDKDGGLTLTALTLTGNLVHTGGTSKLEMATTFQDSGDTDRLKLYYSGTDVLFEAQTAGDAMVYKDKLAAGTATPDHTFDTGAARTTGDSADILVDISMNRTTKATIDADGDLDCRRLGASKGTAVQTTDFTIGGGGSCTSIEGVSTATRGTAYITTGAAETTLCTFTFPVAFAAKPYVVISGTKLTGGGSIGSFTVYHKDVTVSDFDFTINDDNGDSKTIEFSWHILE